jgi:hypothetical protein
MMPRAVHLIAGALLLLLFAWSPNAAGEQRSSDGRYALPGSSGSWALPSDRPQGRAPSEEGTAEVRGVGILPFDPSQIETQRPELFQPGHFSVFDVLVHLTDSGMLDMTYHWDDEAAAFVIDAINGLEGWWYDAHYQGGWFERTVVRIDQFPVKDGMSITVYLEDPERLAAIRSYHRASSPPKSGDVLTIPVVTFQSCCEDTRFEDVEVRAHDTRDDVFRPGTITVLDVLLSLGEQGSLDALELHWRAEAATHPWIDSYLVEGITGTGFAPAMSPGCALTHQVSSEEIAEYLAAHTHTTAHIHLSADLEVLGTPQSVHWRWNCQ